jgi:hypothetical protein
MGKRGKRGRERKREKDREVPQTFRYCKRLYGREKECV